MQCCSRPQLVSVVIIRSTYIGPLAAGLIFHSNLPDNIRLILHNDGLIYNIDTHHSSEFPYVMHISDWLQQL